MEFDYSLCKQNKVDGVFMSPLIENAGFHKIPYYPGATDDFICTFVIAAPIAFALYKEMPDYMHNLAERYLPQWCLEVNEKFNSIIGF